MLDSRDCNLSTPDVVAKLGIKRVSAKTVIAKMHIMQWVEFTGEKKGFGSRRAKTHRITGKGIIALNERRVLPPVRKEPDTAKPVIVSGWLYAPRREA